MLCSVLDESNDILGGLTFWAIASCNCIVIFTTGTMSVQYFWALYYHEMELVLTWSHWQQPLAVHSALAKCNHTCRDLRIFDLPVPCWCLAISLVSPDKASKARFLLQVFCKPLSSLFSARLYWYWIWIVCHCCCLHHTARAAAAAAAACIRKTHHLLFCTFSYFS